MFIIPPHASLKTHCNHVCISGGSLRIEVKCFSANHVIIAIGAPPPFWLAELKQMGKLVWKAEGRQEGMEVHKGTVCPKPRHLAEASRRRYLDSFVMGKVEFVSAKTHPLCL